MPQNREVMLWIGGNGNEMYATSSLKDSDQGVGAMVLIKIFSYSSIFMYLQ